MAFDLPVEMVLNWPVIMECASQKPPEMPAAVPQVGQSTDDFIRNYNASRLWGIQYQQIVQCKMALNAWMAGWEAGHTGLPKDPAAKAGTP